MGERGARAGPELADRGVGVELLGVATGLLWAPCAGPILGIILTIFVVLLITDILGFTKVFPFTRSIR